MKKTLIISYLMTLVLKSEKNIKKALFSILMCFTLSVGISQSNDPLPKAEMTVSSLQADTVQYSFLSNYYIAEYKAPLLEQRLLNRYNTLLDIEIASDTQTVIIKIVKTNGPLMLNQFVKHFKYDGYEIN